MSDRTARDAQKIRPVEYRKHLGMLAGCVAVGAMALSPLAAGQDSPPYEVIDESVLTGAEVVLDRCLTDAGEANDAQGGGETSLIEVTSDLDPIGFRVGLHTFDQEWSFRRFTWDEINQENLRVPRADEFRAQVVFEYYNLDNITSSPFVFRSDDTQSYFISYCLDKEMGVASPAFDGPNFYPTVFIRPESEERLELVLDIFDQQGSIYLTEIADGQEVLRQVSQENFREIVDAALSIWTRKGAESVESEIPLSLELEGLPEGLIGTTVTVWWEIDGNEPPDDSFVARLVEEGAASAELVEPLEGRANGGGSSDPETDGTSADLTTPAADPASLQTAEGEDAGSDPGAADGEPTDAAERDPATAPAPEDPAAATDLADQAPGTGDGPDGADTAAPDATEAAAPADDPGAPADAAAELPASGEVAEDPPSPTPIPQADPVAIQVPGLLADVDLSDILRVAGCDGDVRRDGIDYFVPCAFDGPYSLIVGPFEPIALDGRITVLSVEDFRVAEATFASATDGAGGAYGLAALAAPEGVRLPQDFSAWPDLGESGRVAEACYRTVRLDIALLPSGTALTVEPGCTVVEIDRPLADIPVDTNCLNAADWMGIQCVLPDDRTPPRAFVDGLGGPGTVSPMALDAWLALETDPRPAWPYPGSPVDHGYVLDSVQYCTGGGGCCGQDASSAFAVTGAGDAVMPPVAAGACPGPVDTVQVGFTPMDGGDALLVDQWALTDGGTVERRPFPWAADDPGAIGLEPELAAAVGPRIRAATWSGGDFRSTDRIVFSDGSDVCPTDPTGAGATVETLGLEGIKPVDLQPPVAARISDGERFISECLTGQLSLTVDFDLDGREVAPAGGLVVFLTRSERFREAGMAGAIVAALRDFATSTVDGLPPVPLTLIVDNGDGVPETVLSPIDLDVDDPAAEIRRRLGDLQFNAVFAPPLRGLRQRVDEIEAIDPQALVIVTSDESESFASREVHTPIAWRSEYGIDLFVAGRVDCAAWRDIATASEDRCIAFPERAETEESRLAVRNTLVDVLDRAAAPPVQTSEAVE